MEGVGAELSVVNMMMLAVVTATAAWFGSKIRVLMRVDLDKLVRRNNRMWTHYVKEKLDDTGDISDLLD